MHPLDDVPAIVEYSLDVFRIDGACEVRVTVVLAVAARRTYALQRQADRSNVRRCLSIEEREINCNVLRAPYTYEKLVSDKVLGPYNIR